MIKYFILVSLIFQACCDIDNCPSEFHIPADIYPYKTSYSIGDTIYFKAMFSRKVLDMPTNDSFDLGGIHLDPNTNIQNLGTKLRTKISSEFYYGVLKGEYNEFVFSNGGSEIDGQYKLENDSFKLVYYIVPKLKGSYILVHNHGVGSRFNSPDFPGKCNNRIFFIFTDMNKGKDGNFELLKYSVDSMYSYVLYNYPPENKWFKNYGCFCFNVE